MKPIQLLAKKRNARKNRVRSKIRGTSARPRLHVFRSSHHIYAQIIDDSKGVTLVSASTKEVDLTDKDLKGTKIEQAVAVGTRLARRAKKNTITAVCFDRGYFKYHGRVRALADAARDGGLDF